MKSLLEAHTLRKYVMNNDISNGMLETAYTGLWKTNCLNLFPTLHSSVIMLVS